MRYLALTLLIALCLSPMSAFAKPKSFYVESLEAQIRANPAAFGSIIENVKRGDRLEVLSENDYWINVSNPATGKTGWIHKAALSKKKIKMASGDENLSGNVSGGELALAGKGFDERIEKNYRDTHSNIDFSWIDKMVKIKVSEEKCLAFLKEGEVTPQDGGKE